MTQKETIKWFTYRYFYILKEILLIFTTAVRY